ncbi:hypothetical protein CCACVL1_17480, partial [Corchorus capsularis]
ERPNKTNPKRIGKAQNKRANLEKTKLK